MFERTPEEVKATPARIYIDERTARYVGEFAEICQGWQTFTYDQVLSLYALAVRMLPNVPKRQFNVVRAFANTLATSYGPDMGMSVIR